MAELISFSLADSLNNINHPPRRVALPRSEFVQLFHTSSYKVLQDKRRANVWMPCTFTYMSREAEYVSDMSLFVVDCDTFTDTDLHNTVSRLTTSNHHFLLHSSHGYLPPEKAKVRFIFFLDCPIPIGTQWRWSEAIWPRLTEYLGFKADDADSACSDASRAFFLPIKKGTTYPTLFHYHAGADLPTSTILGDIFAQPLSRYDFRREYISREDPSRVVDLTYLRFALRAQFNPKSDYGKAVRAVLEAEETSEGSRHQTLRLFTHALARVAKPEDSSEALLEIMYPWLNKLGERANEGEALRALCGAREKLPTWNAWEAARLAKSLGLFDGVL